MKLIVFDCDGTLVDSQHLIVAAMERAFADRALALPVRDNILGVVGLSLPIAIERLVPHMSVAAIDDLAEGYKAAFGELRRDPLQREPLYPGVREILNELGARDDVMLGVATGKSRRGVAAILEREGLDGLFQTIQTADTHLSKPDPSMLITAMAEAGCGPPDTIMIGDTTFDIEMARAAGVRAVAVSWGYHPIEALVTAGAHIVVGDAKALMTELRLFAKPAEVSS